MPDDEDLLDPNTPPVVTPPAAPLPPAPPVATAPTLPSPAPVPAPAPAPRRADPELQARIDDQAQRRVNKQLKALFGTDDPAEIERIRADQAKRLEEHQSLVEANEARKREQMGEVEKLTADLAAMTAERDQYKAQVEEMKKERITNEQNAKLTELAGKFIRPNRIKFALQEFRDYVLKLKVDDRKRINEVITSNWFKKYAADNPDLALESKPSVTTEPEPKAVPATPPAPAAKPGTPPPLLQRRTVPAGGTRPATTPNTPPPADPLGGKTIKPGLPNSMTKEEVRAYAKSQGLPYPG
jgi:hypothetical protein